MLLQAIEFQSRMSVLGDMLLFPEISKLQGDFSGESTQRFVITISVKESGSRAYSTSATSAAGRNAEAQT
jgi:hypothetical protein